MEMWHWIRFCNRETYLQQVEYKLLDDPRIRGCSNLRDLIKIIKRRKKESTWKRQSGSIELWFYNIVNFSIAIAEIIARNKGVAKLMIINVVQPIDDSPI